MIVWSCDASKVRRHPDVGDGAEPEELDEVETTVTVTGDDDVTAPS